jgi:hypothetical protein
LSLSVIGGPSGRPDVRGWDIDRLPVGRGEVNDVVPGNSRTMTDPEQPPDVEQRLAEQLDPDRHRAPSEGVPQDLADDPDAEDDAPS